MQADWINSLNFNYSGKFCIIVIFYNVQKLQTHYSYKIFVWLLADALYLCIFIQLYSQGCLYYQCLLSSSTRYYDDYDYKQDSRRYILTDRVVLFAKIIKQYRRLLQAKFSHDAHWQQVLSISFHFTHHKKNAFISSTQNFDGTWMQKSNNKKWMGWN